MTGKTHHRMASARRVAFTLIELLTVVAMIAVIATFALPKVNVVQYQMDAAVRTVRGTLQIAQRTAITRQFDVVVSFDTARGMVRVHEDKNNDAVVQADERTVWKSLDDRVRFATPPAGLHGAASAGVDGTTTTEDGMPAVIFRRDGTASEPVDIYLGSQRAAPNDYRGVELMQSTGRVDWFRYLSGAWKRGSL